MRGGVTSALFAGLPADTAVILRHHGDGGGDGYRMELRKFLKNRRVLDLEPSRSHVLAMGPARIQAF